MEPDMKERREFIYIPSHIVFHPANEATPGVMNDESLSLSIHSSALSLSI